VNCFRRHIAVFDFFGIPGPSPLFSDCPATLGFELFCDFLISRRTRTSPQPRSSPPPNILRSRRRGSWYNNDLLHFPSSVSSCSQRYRILSVDFALALPVAPNFPDRLEDFFFECAPVSRSVSPSPSLLCTFLPPSLLLQQPSSGVPAKSLAPAAPFPTFFPLIYFFSEITTSFVRKLLSPHSSGLSRPFLPALMRVGLVSRNAFPHHGLFLFSPLSIKVLKRLFPGCSFDHPSRPPLPCTPAPQLRWSVLCLLGDDDFSRLQEIILFDKQRLGIVAVLRNAVSFFACRTWFARLDFQRFRAPSPPLVVADFPRLITICLLPLLSAPFPPSRL